ncbi:MAG: dephospho-CoA kinase [bacterium]|nr:MAG: dephospho-CoA kinase [bacterium]
MKPPIIVVTGAIGSGKSTVARILASAGGTMIDCDALAKRALDTEEVHRRLTAQFGTGILTRSGRLSPTRLGRAVFADEKKLRILNRIIRPYVKGLINDEVRRFRTEAVYIVLDAVLFFQYKFRFKVDLVVATKAPEDVRRRRLVTGRGISYEDAAMRIDRQRRMHRDWLRADIILRTDVPRAAMRRTARAVRDSFLRTHGLD